VLALQYGQLVLENLSEQSIDIRVIAALCCYVCLGALLGSTEPLFMI